MSRLVRFQRTLHELLVLATLAALVLATSWIVRWGFTRSGSFPLVIGVVAGLVAIGVTQLRTAVDAAAQRVYDAVPFSVLWLGYVAVSFVLTLLDLPDPARWAAHVTAISTALVVAWTWLLATSVRKLVDVFGHGEAASG